MGLYSRLVIRAVHLEVVLSFDSNAFINALTLLVRAGLKDCITVCCLSGSDVPNFAPGVLVRTQRRTASLL